MLNSSNSGFCRKSCFPPKIRQDGMIRNIFSRKIATFGKVRWEVKEDTRRLRMIELVELFKNFSESIKNFLAYTNQSTLVCLDK